MPASPLGHLITEPQRCLGPGLSLGDVRIMPDRSEPYSKAPELLGAPFQSVLPVAVTS